MGNADEWRIEKIASHIGKGSDATFEVVWKAGDKAWLSGHDIKHLTAFTEYLEAYGVSNLSQLPNEAMTAPVTVPVSSIRVSAERLSILDQNSPYHEINEIELNHDVSDILGYDKDLVDEPLSSMTGVQSSRIPVKRKQDSSRANINSILKNPHRASHQMSTDSTTFCSFNGHIRSGNYVKGQSVPPGYLLAALDTQFDRNPFAIYEGARVTTIIDPDTGRSTLVKLPESKPLSFKKDLAKPKGPAKPIGKISTDHVKKTAAATSSMTKAIGMKLNRDGSFNSFLYSDSASVKSDTKAKDSALPKEDMADITQAQLDGIKEGRARYKQNCVRLKQESDDLKVTVSRLAEEKAELNRRLTIAIPDQQKRFGNRALDNRGDVAAMLKAKAAERIALQAESVAESSGGTFEDTVPDDAVIDDGDMVVISAETVSEDGEIDTAMGVSISDLILRFSGILRVSRI